MIRQKKLCFLFSLIWFAFTIHAQDGQNFKFGKITPADFALTAEKFDSGANAIIIADIGTVKFDGGSLLIFTHFMRVKIINKNGLDIGNREISLYHNGVGDNEKVYSLKGATYNLENGIIKEDKLDERSVFTQKYSKHIDDKKFSMPALKEGAIFDLEYTVKSPFFFRLNPWQFQGIYPRLWSEYSVTIPEPLHYVMRIQGDKVFMVDTTREGTEIFDNSSVNTLNRRWVKTNVPSLQEEPFTTTIDNYYSKVSFQLDYIQWKKDGEKHYQQSTWNLLSKDLMEDEDFGAALNNDGGWLMDEVNKIVRPADSEKEKTVKLYGFVRNHFKSNGEKGLYLQSSFKEIFKKRTGCIADINLLLTAMLIKAGVKSEAMILSTRENGMADPGYPLVAEYNYVICIALPEGRFVTLDASNPRLKYGEIPFTCYNGYGHIIDALMPVPVYFSADSLQESSFKRVIIINDEKGKPSGELFNNPGRNESYQVRNEISTSSLKEYEKKVRELNASDFTIDNFGVDSLEKCDDPLTIHYEFNLKNLESDQILYFNPMMNEGYKTNPFKDADRKYPVEMPCRIDETYALNMEIPVGYQVEELPKSARVAYNENEGMFEYMIQQGDGRIQMRMRLSLNKVFFPTDEYTTLRDFFAYVVKKEGEQIVFKKTK